MYVCMYVRSVHAKKGGTNETDDRKSPVLTNALKTATGTVTLTLSSFPPGV